VVQRRHGIDYSITVGRSHARDRERIRVRAARALDQCVRLGDRTGRRAGLASPRLGRTHRHSAILVDLHDKPARIGVTFQAPQTSHLPKNDRVCVGAPFDRKSLGHLLLEEGVKACLTCARRVDLTACHLELQVSHAESGPAIAWSRTRRAKRCAAGLS
jgi:hypothetical protein